MESMSQVWAAAALERWQTATVADFGHLTLAVVVLGWFISRFDRAG